MANGEKKLVVSLKNISIRNEEKDEMDMDLVILSDEENLLETSIVKPDEISGKNERKFGGEQRV